MLLYGKKLQNNEFQSLIAKIILCFISISGIRNDIRPTLKILKPITLIQVFDQAIWQEKSDLAISRKNKFISRASPSFSSGKPPGNPSFKTSHMKNGLLLRKKNICLRHYTNKEEG